MKRACLLFFMALALPAFGQDAPIVRMTITPESVAVGEAAQLRVTVLVPTWFTKPPEFPAFEIPNLITRLPPDSSRPTAENVGSDRWAGIVRNYRMFPLMGANYRIGGQAMRISYANPGADPISAEVTIPEVLLQATVPAGAESLDPYIAGSSFELRRDIDRDISNLNAGDAMVVTYSAELDGLPAIFLPPLAPDIEARTVSEYPDEPTISDGPPATRTEKTTLVLNYGGDVELPPLAINWWNTETGAIQTATVDALTVPVIGAALAEPEQAEERPGVDWQRMAIVALIVVVLVRFLRRRIPPLVEKRRIAREEYKKSEEYAFAELNKELQRNNPAVAYGAVLRWQAQLDPGHELHTFVGEFGDEKLLHELDALSGQLYAAGDATVNMKHLARGLAAARERFLTAQAVSGALIPALNP